MTRRLFVAVPLPDAVRDPLAAYVERFGTWAGTRLTKPGNLHVTLRFLGDVDERDILDLMDALSGIVAESRRFRLRFRGCEYAPPQGVRTMVWARFADDRGFDGIVRAVSRATDAFVGRTHEEKPPIPHVTLVRFKDEVPWDAQPLPPLALPDIEARSFALYASSVREQGREYDLLRTFPLGTGA